MNYFLPIAYILFFVFILYTMKRYYVSVLSPLFVISIFILKVIAGILYGWIHLHYYNGGDTFYYLKLSESLYSVLHKNPWDFIHLVFGPVHHAPAYIQKYIEDPLFPTDSSTYLMIRYNILVLPLSRGIYNVHVIIYEFINVWGLIFLYRFFMAHLKGKEILLKSLIFFLPSILFWCSGLHKDGFALTSLGLLLYGIDKLLQNKWQLKYLFYTLFGAFFLLLARDYMFLLIVPCLGSYALCTWFPKYKFVKWLLIHIAFFFIIFNIKNFFYFKQLDRHYDFLGYLIFKQNDFIDLTLSRANIPVPRLQHNYMSLLSAIPYSLNHCLFRPHIFEITSAIQYPSATENLLIIIAIICTMLFFSLRKANINLLLFLCFYCFTQFVLIGITVTNLGALARYRAIGILFFLIALLLVVDEDKWLKIKSKLQQFIKINI
jgi:hypothetical protein